MNTNFKKLVYITLSISLGFVSCTDLNENVYSKLPSDTFGNTTEQINAIIGPAYTSLQNYMYYESAWGMSELTSDMTIAPTRLGGDWWEGGWHMEQCMHTWNPSSYSVETLWNNCMSALTTVNSVISTIEENKILAEDLKIRYMSELRGLRAFWYYVLIDFFGNVPLVTDYKDLELPAITPRKQIYEFIVSELNEITPYLLSDVSSATYGRFTQGAAHTLLAKMYLNAEEWIGKENWQGAIDECDKVMQLDYIIEPNWKTNFQVHNEVSKEAILPICYTASQWGNLMHLYTLHYLDPIALGFKGDMWNGINAKPDFVYSFAEDDPRKEYTFLIGPMIDPETKEVLITSANRPLIHTIDLHVIPGTEKTDANGNPTIWGEVHQEEGARIAKWEFDSGMQNTCMENDVAIFRLADVYLMKAEALVRLGKDNGEATRLVNAIRERAFGDSDHNLASVTLDDVYNERRFELAFEGIARQDMIRFGTFLRPAYMKPQQTEEYRKIFPIPYKAWQKNNKLVQNPGYPAF